MGKMILQRLASFKPLVFLSLAGIALLFSPAIQAQEVIYPEYTDYAYYDFATGSEATYLETRNEAWHNYVNNNDNNEDSYLPGVGQIGIVDLYSTWLAVYNYGYEYYAHYDLSGYDLDDYNAEITVYFERPPADPSESFYQFTPWKDADLKRRPISLIVEGIGTVAIGETREYGSVSFPVSLDSGGIDIKVTAGSLKTSNPVDSILPLEDTIYEEFVYSDIEMMLYPNNPINIKPTANIISINPGSAVTGQEITFQGSGTDPDGTIIFCNWRSSIDGYLSSEESFSTNGLSGGVHTIYFKVQDNSGFWSDEVSRTLNIRQLYKPEANIVSITPNKPEIGQEITFEGSGEDSDGKITAYSWTLSNGQQLSNQASFAVSNLSEGEYTIYFKVQDDDGLWSDEVSQVLTVGSSDTTPDVGQGKHPHDPENCVGEPINVVTGNMYTTQHDLSIPGRELNFDFSRTYNSHKAYSGPIGYGWTHSYNIVLTDFIDKTKIMLEDGRAIYFTKESDSSFTAPTGEYSELTKEDGNFIWRLKNGITYYFDSTGKLLSIKGRNNNYIGLTYTGNLLTKVTDSVGREVIFSYNDDKHLSQITGPAGRTVQYNYDSSGNLTSVTDLNGNITSYQYDSNHNLTKATDPQGRSLYYEYDEDDRCIVTYYDDNIARLELTYNSPDYGSPTTVIVNSKGYSTSKSFYQYDLVSGVYNGVSGRHYYWDSDYNRIQITDENGNITKMTYDSRGNLLTTTDAQGNKTTFEYEPAYNLITKTVDPQGNITRYNYDDRGNLTSTTDALGNKTAYSYDIFGQLILKTDANSTPVVYEYDDKGNLISTTNSFDAETKFAYDAVGNLISTTDPKDNTTTYTYDNANQLIKTTYPDLTFAQFGYDKSGNRTSITDPNGNVTKFEYTPTNKISKKEDSLGRITLYTYDTEENLIKVTDPKENITEYTYDNLNRLIEEKNPLGLTKTYTYDNVGNKTSFTDEKSQNIQYQYNNLNQLIKTTYPDDTYITYTYNKSGRKISAEDSNLRKTQYGYDNLGRINAVDGPDDNDTIFYEYDKLGNRVKMTGQDGGVTTYNYDELSRLTQIIDSREQTTDYIYDENDNLVLTAYPNNMETDYTYDNMNRLASLTNTSPYAEVISSYGYTYDSGGRKTKVTLSNGEINYTYDKANQLIQETRTSSTSSYSLSYQYDLSGNRKQMIKNGETIDYSYNNFNQLTSQTNSAYSGGNKTLITGEVKDQNIDKVLLNDIQAAINNNVFSAKIPLIPGPNTITAQAIDKSGNTSISTLQIELDPSLEASYTYDNNGNLIQKSYRGEHTVYSYNYDNQLTKILYPDASTEEYTYDTQGKRKTRDDGRGTKIDYLYDGNTVILEKTEGETTASYTRGLSLGGGIGSIISKYDGEHTYYYLYDGQGNVTHLTNEDGEVIISYEYDAFGNITHQSGSLENEYQYQTKEYNSDSGLVFFGARYYDPTIGRFTTPDPLGMVDGPNVYLYLNNDPINLIDPWGLCGEGPTKINVTLDVVAFVGDLVSLIPTPWTMIGGYAISAIASTINARLTIERSVDRDYSGEKASTIEEVDTVVTITSTIVSYYPGVISAVGSGAQLLYDQIRYKTNKKR